MASFQASKYDPLKDEHLPQIGSIIEGFRIIKKVQPIELGELMKLQNKQPDLEGYSEILITDNPERPGLKYLIWVDEIKNSEYKGKFLVNMDALYAIYDAGFNHGAYESIIPEHGKQECFNATIDGEPLPYDQGIKYNLNIKKEESK
jgi:hypothetical protein